LHQIVTYIVVLLGAGLGGTLRHGVNVTAARWLGTSFPYGTLTVNVLGSLAMGLLIGYFALRSDPGQLWRLFLTTGVLGGFTTFSTFSLDVVTLVERGQSSTAAIYAGASLVLGVAALFIALVAVRQVWGVA
jgi:CrcB protein